MTSWFSEAVVAPTPRTTTRSRPAAKPKAATRPSPRPKAKRRKNARGAIGWIAVSAVVLAGVVFVNLGVLRLNLELDSATTERSKLRAENATLQSNLSRLMASPRLQALARNQNGLVDADPAAIGYIDLSR